MEEKKITAKDILEAAERMRNEVDSSEPKMIVLPAQLLFDVIYSYQDEIADLEKQMDHLVDENRRLDPFPCRIGSGCEAAGKCCYTCPNNRYRQHAAKEFAGLVEFHSVATRDEDGFERFTISALGLKEILREQFGVEVE
jgi:hypothetical protein